MHLVTSQGQIYYEEVDSNHIRTGVSLYLCGSNIMYVPARVVSMTSYYTSDKGLAINMFDWYQAVCSVYNACTGNTLIETMIGARAGVEGYTPWSISIGDRHIRPENPDYGKALGITWCDNYGNSTGEVVTPESLAITAKPILKKQSPQEWAFKMGTLYGDVYAPTDTGGMLEYNWVTISSHKGYEWVRNYLCGEYDKHDGVTILTAYFKLGTYCKWGTPFRLVHSSAHDMQTTDLVLRDASLECYT